MRRMNRMWVGLVAATMALAAMAGCSSEPSTSTSASASTSTSTGTGGSGGEGGAVGTGGSGAEGEECYLDSECDDGNDCTFDYCSYYPVIEQNQCWHGSLQNDYCTVPGGAGGVCTDVVQDSALTTICVPCATTESCDGVDNDCNGQIDEGNPPAVFEELGYCTATSCGVQYYTCEGGPLHCGELIPMPPMPEVCDMYDNDCDGEIDEDTEGGPCTVPDKLGVCAAGKERCGGWELWCEQQQFPTTETCNGLDDDCDGQTDEGLNCNCQQIGQMCSFLKKCCSGLSCVNNKCQ